MAKTTDEKATRVLEPVDLREWLGKDDNKRFVEALTGAAEVKDGERLVGLVGKNIRADIQTANTKVEDKKYDAEYVSVSALTIEGAALLMSNVIDETFEGEGDERREKPSVVKYFNQGYGILARNAAAARIRVKVEGPDKALVQAAKGLARAKGWEGEEGFQKAMAKIRQSMED